MLIVTAASEARSLSKFARYFRSGVYTCTPCTSQAARIFTATPRRHLDMHVSVCENTVMMMMMTMIL